MNKVKNSVKDRNKHSTKSESTEIAERRMREDSRTVRILDEITKKFIFSGLPLAVKSRGNVKYDWTPNEKKFRNDLDFCNFIMDFITNEMPDMHRNFNPYNVGDVGLAISGMVEENGTTTDGYNAKDIVDKNGIPKSINTARSRETYSVDEAVKDILVKYGISTAIDGSYLMFVNRDTGKPEPPFAGIGPFIKVAHIFERELSFAQPESSLIASVVSKLYEIARKNPFILINKSYADLTPKYIGVDGELKFGQGGECSLYVIAGYFYGHK